MIWKQLICVNLTDTVTYRKSYEKEVTDLSLKVTKKDLKKRPFLAGLDIHYDLIWNDNVEVFQKLEEYAESINIYSERILDGKNSAWIFGPITNDKLVALQTQFMVLMGEHSVDGEGDYEDFLNEQNENNQ